MEKLIKPEEFGAHILTKQGEKTDTQYALETGIGRQVLRYLKAGEVPPSPAVLIKLNMGVLYYDLPAKPAPAKKKAKVPGRNLLAKDFKAKKK